MCVLSIKVPIRKKSWNLFNDHRIYVCVVKHMTWIFGSFLVTLCALASWHILISKQDDDSAIRAVGHNRCVTGMRPRNENNAVRFRQPAENRSRARDTQPIRGVSDELARGCKRWHPPGSGKKIWEEEVLSLSICHSTHLSLTTEISTLSGIKCERHIFINRCVRSFIEVRKLCLIMFPLVFVYQVYNIYIYIYIYILAKWVECSPMVRETWVQS